MILRLALFGLMALGLLGFGAVAWVSSHPKSAADQHAEPVTKAVLVLTHDARAGSLLKADDLAAKTLPSAELLPDALLDEPTVRRSLLGGMVRRALSAGDVLRASDVMRPGEHGFLAAVLRPGMRAVTVAVDAVSGTAGLIWPGDRVDVILTQTLDDTRLPPGHRIAGETVLEDARVIAIDQLLVQGAAPDSPDAHSPRTVTLEVAGKDAERVQVASRIGKLALSVRAAELSGNPPAGISSAEPTWAGEVSRALEGGQAPTPPAGVLRVFNGAGEPKEFRY